MRLTLIFLFIPLLFSFKFNPMSQSLELSEGKKSSQFTVENDTEKSMAIELTVKERKMNLIGIEQLPATPDLSIFPPQMIIPPKEKRTVRVSWNGPSDLKTEKPFRVIAEQMNVKVDEKDKRQTGIEIKMIYMAAFYIAPKDIESKLSARIETSDEAKEMLIAHQRALHEAANKNLPPKEQKPFTYKPGLLVRVINSGSKHQILLKPKLVFKKGSEKWTLEEKDLAGFAGENVLANSERVFDIRTNKNISPNAEVSLKVED